ncbi:MAG: hypothetical protein AAGB06_04315 [Verrucomicrobiota bacterium]
MKITSLPLPLTLLLASAALAPAQIVTYTFATNVSPTTEDANVSASDFGVGIGITTEFGRSSGSQNYFVRSTQTGSSLPDAISNNEYLTFTITPDSGFQMNLTSIDIQLGGNANIPGQTVSQGIFTSVDGFTAVDEVFSSSTALPSNNAETLDSLSIPLAGPQYSNITTATEFRVYLYDNNDVVNVLHRADNVVINGTVTPIPEPGSSALVAAWV